MKKLSSLTTFVVLSFITLLFGVSCIDFARTEGDPDLAAYLREAIENFREQMTKGIPAIKMPVLDPLKLNDLNVDVYENLARINLRIKEVQIKNLSNFILIDLNPNLEEFYLHLNLSLPEISASGEYVLDGRVLKVFPIYGAGNFSINATDVFIGGIGQLESDEEEDTLQMSTLKLDLWWDTLIFDLENFLNGTRFSEVLQKAIPDVGRGIFNRYKPRILGRLEDALLKKVNEKLNDPLVKDIIHGIFSD